MRFKSQVVKPKERVSEHSTGDRVSLDMDEIDIPWTREGKMESLAFEGFVGEEARGIIEA